jgi:hypothetical protein
MAKQEDFIEKLGDFTQSLENLVDILKEQSKKGPSDVLETFLENLDADKIAQITSDLSEIKNSSKKIETQQDKILAEVQSIKSSKETGLVGEVGTSGKNTIIEGVKTIILIAGGVLAIGLAFKLIGNVDFASVVGLSLGMIAVAIAFERMSKLEGLTYEKTLFLSSIMPIMAVSLYISGKVLSGIPSFSINQSLSIGFIGLAMGISVYGIMKGLGDVDIVGSIAKLILIPLIIPLVAKGLVASAKILKDMPLIGMNIIMSSVGVAIAMVPMMLAASFLSKGMANMTITQMLLFPIVMPLLAYGLVLSSKILQDTQSVPFFKVILAGISVGVATLFMVPVMWMLSKAGLLKTDSIKELGIGLFIIPTLSLLIVASSAILVNTTPLPFWPVLSAGIAIGFATLAMVPTIILLQKFGLLKPSALKELAIGVITIPLISLMIMTSSHILSLGNYKSYPTFQWSLGVGLALSVFAIPIVAIGLLVMAGVGLPAMAAGLLAVPLISMAIVISSYILATGNYKNYPSFGWSAGVGLSLVTFGASMLVLGIMVLSGIGIPALMAGLLGISIVSLGIVSVSYILASGKYDKFPSFDWASGVGLSLLAFGGGMIALGVLMMTGIGILALLAGIEGVKIVANGIVDTSFILASGNYDKFPSFEWSSGVGLSLLAFGSGMILLGAMMITGVGYIALKMGKSALLGIAESIVEVSFILAGGNYDKYPTAQWIAGVGASLMAFGATSLLLAGLFWAIDDGLDAFIKLSYGISTISILLNNGNYDTSKSPSEQWFTGVYTTIKGFISLLNQIKDENFDGMSILYIAINSIVWIANALSSLKDGVFEPGGITDNISTSLQKLMGAIPKQVQVDPLYNLAYAIDRVATSIENMPILRLAIFSNRLGNLIENLQGIDPEKINSLMNFSLSLNAMGLVNTEQLEKTLDVLDAKQKQLTGIIDSDNNPITDIMKKFTSGGKEQNMTTAKTGESKKELTPEQKFQEELLTHVISIDTNISKLTSDAKKSEELKGKNVEDDSWF